jgi:hypothetical protein
MRGRLSSWLCDAVFKSTRQNAEPVKSITTAKTTTRLVNLAIIYPPPFKMDMN